jgi:spore coat protein E
MNEIREILTKAVIGKGRRFFSVTTMMPETEGIVDKILSTAMINHETTASKEKNVVHVKGSYDIHVWYAYSDEKETAISRETVTYDAEISLENALRNNILATDDIIAEEILPPYATDVRIETGIIYVDVDFEIGVEVIGETKMRVAILGPVVEKVHAEVSYDPDDDLAEIDTAITPHFLEATILPFE